MSEHIAIVRLSAIGDVVHGLPLAGSLHRRRPDAVITWITQAGPAPLLADHPFVDRVLEFPRRSGPRAVTRFLADLPGEEFDTAIDAQGNVKSGIVLAATRAPRRIGLARCEYREPLGSLGANEHAPSAAGPHSVDRTLALARHLGDPDPRTEYGLAPSADEMSAATADLAGLAPPIAVLSVGGADDVREWPDGHWREAIRRTADAGATPLILAGPTHRERAEELARATGADVRAGTTDLRGLLAHLSVLAATGSAALLACDSAPLHLAVAVGLPVVSLAGPQDPDRTGPYGHREDAITAWEGLDCAPCRKRRCRYAREPLACMKRISPATAVERLLRPLGLA